MRLFRELFEEFDWQEIKNKIYSTTSKDVEQVLSRTPPYNLQDMLRLLSPAALNYLPEILDLSQKLTWQRFGKTIHLFIPVYLSNECHNICTYCGFSFTNQNLKRITLTPREIEAEARAVAKMGFEHVLLVSGEAWTVVTPSYLKQAIEIMHRYFSQVSIEVQPLDQPDYEYLRQYGMHAVVVYQETYSKADYARYHLKGRKKRFYYRLETPERAARAGVRKIGMGILVGLTDWRTDAWMLALHLDFMRTHYWKQLYSVAFPRLRPAEGFAGPAIKTTNKEYMQLIAVFRLFDPDLDIVLSTREAPGLRNILFQIGVTSVSAGSKTEPGAYALHKKTLAQFEIADTRTPEEIVRVLTFLGLKPVWKDWEPALV